MSNDSVRTVTTQSWFSRIKESFVGILIGLVLFLVAFPVLFLNEGRALRTAKGLQEGASAVVSIENDTIDPAMDKKLVHITGDATTVEQLNDADFNLTVNAVALRRTTEMYQWEERKHTETRDKLGGSTETVTTYTYHKTWSPRLIASSSFEEPTGHTNPTTMPFSELTTRASLVTVGAFKLPASLITQMDDFQPLQLTPAMHQNMPADIQAQSQLSDQFLFLGNSPQNPEIGDTRISFQVVKPGPVSIVARQLGNTFEPYTTSTNTQIAMLYNGIHSAENMFQTEISANKTLTWILRGVGTLLMFIGLILVFRPIAVMASVVPFIGKIFGAGTTFIAAAISIPLSLTTIAIGWIVYRPLIGILLLLGAVAIVAGTIKILKARSPKQADSTT